MNHFFIALSLIFIANSSFATVIIQSRIDEGTWKKSQAIYPLKEQKVTLSVKKTPKAIIRWYQIFPDTSKIYKNANLPWEKNPYQWVGFGKIDYERQELTHFRNQWEIQPFEKPSNGTSNQILSWFKNLSSKTFHEKVGSFWFQVEIEKNGQIQKSPGIKDSNERGLSPKVFRVSIRNGKGYIGYLTTFFNVPGLFGSTTYQSRHYIGVDCADVLVTAYGIWKRKTIKKNYNVAMLVNKLTKLSEFELVNGQPNKKVLWGKTIRAGDFIAVKYAGARQYQHIGALASDANNNNLLDGNDVVLHAGPLPLHYSKLNEGYFDGYVAILRASNRSF